MYESIGMSPVWSGGICSRFTLLVWASYPSCVENVEIPLGCMKSGSCDLGVFPLQLGALVNTCKQCQKWWLGGALTARPIGGELGVGFFIFGKE